MPSVKPRVAIVLEQDAYDVLRGFSKAVERPMASIVVDMVNANIDQFREATVIINKAKGIAKEAIDSVESKSIKVPRAIDQLSSSLVELISLVPVVEGIEGGVRQEK